MLFVSCPDWGENGNFAVYSICPVNSGSGGYSRNFVYDAYGNMAVQSFSGIGLSSLTPYSGGGNTPFDGSNRLRNAGYDLVGNQTNVGSLQIGYDAENRQRSLTDALDRSVSMQYEYDGEGNRVTKSSPAGTTVYVYDVFGQLAAEYSNTAPVASPCRTCYLAYDHLSSVRMVMDEAGNVVARHDYLPFGEEVTGGSAGRNSQFGSADGVNQKFTGQERDSGTVPNLDYFWARYYGSALGRWTSPDLVNLTDDRLLNPSNTINKYVYGGNNPLTRTARILPFFTRTEDPLVTQCCLPTTNRLAIPQYKASVRLTTITPPNWKWLWGYPCQVQQIMDSQTLSPQTSFGKIIRASPSRRRLRRHRRLSSIYGRIPTGSTARTQIIARLRAPRSCEILSCTDTHRSFRRRSSARSQISTASRNSTGRRMYLNTVRITAIPVLAMILSNCSF